VLASALLDVGRLLALGEKGKRSEAMKKRIALLVTALMMMVLMMSFGGVAFAKMSSVRTLAANNRKSSARV
jgi:hypothetical protein